MTNDAIRELAEKYVTFEPVGSPDHLYVCIGEFVAADVKLCNKARGEQIVKFIREQMEAAIREAISLTREEVIEEVLQVAVKECCDGQCGVADRIRALAVRS